MHVSKHKNIKKINTIKPSPETDVTNPERENTRRIFLKKLWGVLGIIAGVEGLAILGNFFGSGQKNKNVNSQNLVLAGHVADFKPGSVFPFRSGKFYLVRFTDGGFMAVSLKCTHLGCSVIWNSEKKEFICPCHASSFNAYGEVVNPPAPRALDTFPVIIREGNVQVDIANEQRRKKFDKSQVTYA